MHFGPLFFELLRKLVDIGGWKRGISHSKYEFHCHCLRCDENRTTPIGVLEKSNFALFQTEFFDSKLNTYRIQSRKFGFGLNIKCRKKYSKSLMCPYNPL